MSYLIQSRLASDDTIMRRITACAAIEGIPAPDAWPWERRWQFSAQPGWVDAYASAIAAGDEEPGANESAITDSMILAAVHSLSPPPDPSTSTTEGPAE